MRTVNIEILEGGQGYDGFLKVTRDVCLTYINVPGYEGRQDRYHAELYAFCGNGDIYSVHPPRDKLAGIRWKVSDFEREELREKCPRFAELDKEICKKEVLANV